MLFPLGGEIELTGSAAGQRKQEGGEEGAARYHGCSVAFSSLRRYWISGSTRTMRYHSE